MLDAIRKRSGSIVVKVLLLFLVLSFGAWGIGDYITGGVGNQAIATVGEREISPQEFNNEYQREMNTIRQVLGGNLDSGMARTLGIHQNVLNRMISREVFAAAAHDLGVIVTDDIVAREIQSMDAFRGLTGNFDKDQFRQAINNAGYTEDMFIALMKSDLNRGFLLESFENGAVAPDVMVKAIYEFREETRAAEIALIPDDAFSNVVEPTEAEIAQYHKDNPDQFMAPEYRSLTYLHLSAEDLAKEMIVSEEEILNAYEAREDEFVSPARRKVEQAIFDSADTANTVLDLMTSSGRSFVDVAAELTGANVDTMALGWIGRDDFISTELADAAFSLEAGGTSVAIESPLGWHVLHIVEAEDEARQSLDQVHDKVSHDVAMEKAVDSLFSLANALEDEMGSGATLEEASQVLDLSIGRIENIDARGLNTDGVSTQVPTDNFLQVAFSIPEGGESPLSESPDDSYFILRVDSVTNSDLRPLETVRDAVRDAMLAERRRAAAEDAASKIVDAVNGGKSLLDALAQVSIGADTALFDVSSFKRNGDGAPEEMPRALSAALFDQTINQGGYARAEGGMPGYVVGRVHTVTMANPAADIDGVDRLKSELVDSIRSSLMDQFANALQDTYTVSINDAILNQFLDSGY